MKWVQGETSLKFIVWLPAQGMEPLLEPAAGRLPVVCKRMLTRVKIPADAGTRVEMKQPFALVGEWREPDPK